MFNSVQYPNQKDKGYQMLIKQVESLIEDENDLIANLSNISALLNDFFTDINWVGFYLMKKNELVLGPFQGKPACTRIAIGQGVCGTAVAEKKTQIIPDVHQFKGHIVCDSSSNSEIVICLYNGKNIAGVLDIDSPSFSRFDEVDRRYLEKLSDSLSKLFKNESITK